MTDETLQARCGEALEKACRVKYDWYDIRVSVGDPANVQAWVPLNDAAACMARTIDVAYQHGLASSPGDSRDDAFAAALAAAREAP